SPSSAPHVVTKDLRVNIFVPSSASCTLDRRSHLRRFRMSSHLDRRPVLRVSERRNRGALAVFRRVEPITIGQRLGPYRIQAVLGAGGTGVVYLAGDRRLLRPVAIKLLD